MRQFLILLLVPLFFSVKSSADAELFWTGGLVEGTDLAVLFSSHMALGACSVISPLNQEALGVPTGFSFDVLRERPEADFWQWYIECMAQVPVDKPFSDQQFSSSLKEHLATEGDPSGTVVLWLDLPESLRNKQVEHMISLLFSQALLKEFGYTSVRQFAQKYFDSGFSEDKLQGLSVSEVSHLIFVRFRTTDEFLYD